MSAVSGSIDSCRSLENGKWRAVARFSEDNYLMCRTVDGVIRYAPLCVSTFRPHSPRVQTGEPDFINQHESHRDFETVPERIRWCRQKRGLSKKAYAHMLGIDSGTLDNWEKDKKRMNRNSWEKLFKELLEE